MEGRRRGIMTLKGGIHKGLWLSQIGKAYFRITMLERYLVETEPPAIT